MKRVELTKREQYVLLTVLRATNALIRNDAGYDEARGISDTVRSALERAPRVGTFFGPPSVEEIDSLSERLSDNEVT